MVLLTLLEALKIVRSDDDCSEYLKLIGTLRNNEVLTTPKIRTTQRRIDASQTPVTLSPGLLVPPAISHSAFELTMKTLKRAKNALTANGFPTKAMAPS